MSPLSPTSLDRLPPDVARPRYDLAAVRTGWAHLGVGAFHRAHQAEYCDDLLSLGHLDWGLLGLNLRPPDATPQLDAQGGLYVRVAREGDVVDRRVIGAVRATARGIDVTRRLADPAVHVVTLTVTEKGYCHVPATGALDENLADVRHDLAHPDAPVSAPGVLVAALSARRAMAAPLSLVSCDNVPNNGGVLRRAVLGLARRRDPGLAEWIERACTFPETMVDRIVPATAADDVATLAGSLGVRDAAPVFCETFRQWVIADRFAGARPPWEEAGAEIVADVVPFEEMKMRLLNGSQSAVAYLGYLGGFEHTCDAMASPALAAYAARLMQFETAPTLRMPEGVDVAAYRIRVLQRMRNAAIRHRTWQIATDGSQKIPHRFVVPLRWHLARGSPAPGLCLAIAAWMQFVSGLDLRGSPIEVSDPLAATLRARADGAGDAAALVAALLGVREVFGDLDQAAAAGIARALQRLRQDGPEAAALEGT